MSLLEKQNIAMPIKTSGQLTTTAAAVTTTISSNAINTTTSTTTSGKPNETTIATEQKQENAIQNSTAGTYHDVFVSLTSGAVAGALAKTTIAPLDRTKINFQINNSVRYTLNGAIQFLKQTHAKEGTLALWRGNSATMARIVPYAAIQFTAHEQWRKILHVDKDGTDTKVRRFMAGSLAGITSQSLTYPLDLARARMAVTDKYTGYRTLRSVFVKIWVKEGPRTLYRGYFATILGVIPYAGTSFFTYETLKREYTKMTGNVKPNTLVSLAFGAIAGVVGQTSSYPLDIVRRRMQTMGVTKDGINKYTNLFSTLKTIYREEGIKNGFYKGLSMNWIKGPIAVGISFSSYDFVKELLRELFHLKAGPSITTNSK